MTRVHGTLGALALAMCSLLVGCPDADSSKSDATTSKAEGKGSKKDGSGSDGKGGPAKTPKAKLGASVALAALEAPAATLFAAVKPEEAQGFGGAIRSASSGVPVLGGALLADANKLGLNGGVTAGTVKSMFEGVQEAFGSATETVEAERVIADGPAGGLMIWRYADTKPAEGGVLAHVGQIMIVGGGAFETALVAVSLDTKQPVAVSPPIQLSAQGKVAKTDSAHRFVIPSSALANASGNLVLALVASRGQGVHNGLPLAVAQLDNGRVAALSPVAEGHLSGRRFLSQGQTQDGTELATLLSFVLFDSRNECLYLEIVEVAKKGDAQEIHRIAGCAKLVEGTLKYAVNMVCKAASGGGEECKKVESSGLDAPFQIVEGGVSFDGRGYAMLPLEDDVKPAPPAPSPQPAPQTEPAPSEPEPAPPPDDGKRRSYSDR